MWPLVEKQRRLLKDEKGYVVKDWGGKTSVALVYPNSYHIGMSNLAVHSLYKLFNDRPDIVCERAFLPEPKDLAEHRRTKTPVLSIESQRPLSDFDCIAFSISFQNDFLNILPILSLCSIPHLKKKRGKDHPLLIAGGCAVTMNHLPLSKIFDTFVIGEVEETIDVIANIVAQSHGIRGIATALSGPRNDDLKRHVTRNLDDWPTQTVIHTPHTEFGNLHLIEMSRGCPRRCKFCTAPCLYAPLRMRSFDAVMNMVKDGLPHRKRMGLIGSDLLSHPKFSDIANSIHDLGATFSPSSLCVDEIDDEVAELLARSGHKSIALGVEAASDKLRSSIGKKFSSDRIIEAACSLAKKGISAIRLYFMIGLPGETIEDIEAIAHLSKRILSAIQKAAPKGARQTSVTLTVTSFVPKPLTPFENAAFAGEKYLKEAIKILKRQTGKTKGISLHTQPIISSICDWVLSKGDENRIRFIERCFETGLRKALAES